MTILLAVKPDVIELTWTGRDPDGATDALLASVITPLMRERRDLPLLHRLKDPEALLTAYPALKGRGRYSKRFKGFSFGLSEANMNRITATFKDFRIVSGHDHLTALKVASQDWKRDMQKIARIKERTDLPMYDYKVPPLAYYQHRATVYLTNVKSAALFVDCGGGKSYSVLCSTVEQQKKGLLTPGKTLIGVKLATIRRGWLDDTAKFTDLKAVSLWAKPGKNRKDKLVELLNQDADIYIVNHDGVKVLYEELKKKRFEKVVIDESTIMKSYRGPRGKTGVLAKAIDSVAQDAKYRVIMTGTPAPNDTDDLWGQFKFLDPYGFALGADFRDFKADFMKDVPLGPPDNPNTRWIPVMTVEGRARVAKLIEPLMFRVRLRDHIKDLPPLTVMARSLEMSPPQLRAYDEMEDQLETELDGELVTVSVKLALINKLRQISGGFLIDVEGKPHEIEHNPKIKMLDDLLGDEIAKDEKVVIFAQYRYEVELILGRYKKMGVRSVYGGNSGSENLDGIDAFLGDESVRIIVLHPRSAAHGITLVNARYMIFYSFSYSEEENYQAVKRIERAVQKREMFVFYLLCEDSIDEVMYDVIKTKSVQQSQLIDQEKLDTDVDAVWRELKTAFKQKRATRRKKAARKTRQFDSGG